MVSVIIPTYNRIAGLEKLIKRLQLELDHVEIIIVDDASVEQNKHRDTFIKLANQYKQVRCILLKNNASQQNATLAGIRAAKGQIFVTIDDDYNHEIDYINQMISCLNQVDVVYGVYEKRHTIKSRAFGTVIKEWLFNHLFHKDKQLTLTSFKVFNQKAYNLMVDDNRPYVYLSASIMNSPLKCCNYPLKDVQREISSNYKWYSLIKLLFRLVFYYKCLPNNKFKHLQQKQYEIKEIIQ